MKRVLTVALIVFALDQLSKLIVVQWMSLKTLGEIEVFPPFLNFSMAWNRGVNFGLFSDDTTVTRWVLTALAVLISVWVARWAGAKGSPRTQFLAGFVVGGAIGNAVDRVVYGAVADFLNMSCCGFDNPYAFNVADVAIFVGALGLALFTDTRDKNT